MKLFLPTLIVCLFSLKVSAQCPVFLADSKAVLSDSEVILWEGESQGCTIENPQNKPLVIYPNPCTDYFEVLGSDFTEDWLWKL